MSEKITKSWERIGELDYDTNKVLRDSTGARALVGMGDLNADGAVSTLHGYSKITTEPMVADYTTGTISVVNGLKTVTGSGTAWLYGSAAELVTNGDMSSATGWTFTGSAGVKWNIASGVATRVANAADPNLVSVAAPASGSKYVLTYTITRTAGTLTVTCGGFTQAHSAGGTFIHTFTASTTAALTFAADATYAGTVDNVSLHVAELQVFRGDLLIGPDAEYYEIADVVSDTELLLTRDYAGADADDQEYAIRHKVWMIAPFNSQVGQASSTKTKSFISTTDGTFDNTLSTSYGVVIDPSFSNGGYGGCYITGSGSVETIVSSGSFKDRAQNGFTLSEDLEISGMWLNFYGTSGSFEVSIFNDSAGVPGSALTTYSSDWVSHNALSGTRSNFYFPFTATPIVMTAGTKYYVHVHQTSGTGYLQYNSSGTNIGLLSSNSGYYYSTTASAWARYGAGYTMEWSFLSYPPAAISNNTYVTETYDMGATPIGDSLLTIDSTGQPFDSYITTDFSPVAGFAASGMALKWELERSSDGSAWTSVVSNQTALSYTITDKYRYYRLTFTLDVTIVGSYGRFTPVVRQATITSPTSNLVPAENNDYTIVGCGNKVFTQESPSATTINTTQSPSVRPASWCAYNNAFFYRHGGSELRYWDVVAAADAAVSAMTKTDGSAGVDPPLRAHCVILHNDKLITAGYAAVLYYSGASTAITETVLTNSGASFTTTGTGMIGWKCRPDTGFIPEQWAVVSSNTGTAATCANAQLITVGRGAIGDTYNLAKFYPKIIFYSTDAEPADWPTTNFLNFNTADGDSIQQIVSHRGNLIVICQDQVWVVYGYGPSTPWEKRLLAKVRGTIAPMSVVSTSDDVYWWSEEGIVVSRGGTSTPVVIDNHIRSLTIDGINAEMKHNIVGAIFKGKLYWSYPSTGSGCNDRTVIFNPESGLWCMWNVGMYCPVSDIEDDGTTVLKFWEPTSGCLCKVDEPIVTLGGSPASFEFTTAFSAASGPTESAQFMYFKVVLLAQETLNVTVSAAYDYSETYTSVGALVPIDSVTSGRTSVNATDTIYVCRFASSVKGAAISLKMTGSSSTPIKIMQLEVVADPVEYPTLR